MSKATNAKLLANIDLLRKFVATRGLTGEDTVRLSVDGWDWPAIDVHVQPEAFLRLNSGEPISETHAGPPNIHRHFMVGTINVCVCIPVREPEPIESQEPVHVA